MNADRKVMPLECIPLMFTQLNLPPLVILYDLPSKLQIQRKVSSIKSKLKKEEDARKGGGS